MGYFTKIAEYLDKKTKGSTKRFAEKNPTAAAIKKAQKSKRTDREMEKLRKEMGWK